MAARIKFEKRRDASFEKKSVYVFVGTKICHICVYREKNPGQTGVKNKKKSE